MQAIILSIGDELVLGQTVDTNSAWLSQQLAAIGCSVAAHMTVGDDQKAIEDAITESATRCEVLLVSGGLGPTDDDLTRQALAKVMNAPLDLNEQWLAELDKFFKNRGRAMPERNRIQAMIPRGAKMIFNTAGTAAGIEAVLPLPLGERAGVRGNVQSAERRVLNPELNSHSALSTQHSALQSPSPHPNPLPHGESGPCRVFVMPGVPKEMKIMFERDVLPHLKQFSGGARILSRTLHTFGLGESTIAEKLGDLMRRDRNPSVGTTVANGVVSLRVNARFDSRDAAEAELDRTANACHEALGDLIYGQDGQTLPEIVNEALKRKGQTVTTAESCTGGLLAKMITDVSGSSDVFQMGFVTYSNAAKYERLGVSTEMINVYGAVSEPVVEAMAKNARRLAKADYALAISGVAGPTGGSATKPVGTVCIALAFGQDNKDIFKRMFNFPGDREFIRDRAAKMALMILRFHLLGKPLPF